MLCAVTLCHSYHCLSGVPGVPIKGGGEAINLKTKGKPASLRERVDRDRNHR